MRVSGFSVLYVNWRFPTSPTTTTSAVADWCCDFLNWRPINWSGFDDWGTVFDCRGTISNFCDRGCCHYRGSCDNWGSVFRCWGTIGGLNNGWLALSGGEESANQYEDGFLHDETLCFCAVCLLR